MSSQSEPVREPFRDAAYLEGVAGTAELDFDFDKKSFAARFKADDGRFADIPAVSGTVQGNRFEGRRGTGVVMGAFYGPQAEEAAGMYSFADLPLKTGGGKTSVVGTFGVKKQ